MTLKPSCALRLLPNSAVWDITKIVTLQTFYAVLYVEAYCMSREEFEKLGPGDMVRSENGESYVVTDRMGEAAIAVRIALIENPDEWELAEKKT
jgi:hypothetical protein